MRIKKRDKTLKYLARGISKALSCFNNFKRLIVEHQAAGKSAMEAGSKILGVSAGEKCLTLKRTDGFDEVASGEKTI